MIKEVSEKDKSAFNKAAVHPLQSWEWGEFRKATGNEVVRLGVYDGKTLTDAIQVIFSRIPRTKYKIGTVIKGPVPTEEMLTALKELAKKENAIFIKLEPNVATKVVGEKWMVDGGKNTKHKTPNTKHSGKELIEILKANGCVRGKTLFTPTTFWIDLNPNEDELLKSFHSKTRYNIRLAQRKGVSVAEDNSDEAFEKYLELTRETVERQGFYAHTEKYHRLMWKHLHLQPTAHNLQPIARLLTARYKGEIITAWVVFVWHDFLYYPYGASTDKHKKVMANNLMMWEAIRLGKKLGLKTFDLWGREEGKGFTKFKEGYNPSVVEFLGTWDLPASPLYKPYLLAENIRWKLLRARTKLMFTKPKF
jgi:lipid II:glycine glycyltransferase (peptidoglycan interpeptide bridge formation enzyme)